MSAGAMAPKLFFILWLGALGGALAQSPPSTCQKGMESQDATAPYPYPVVHIKKKGVDRDFLCDTTTDTGGWIVIQRRTNGEVDFFLGWEDYKQGFGELSTDFWIGLETMHRLTANSQYELRVELEYNGTSAYAEYSNFYVAHGADNYRLSLGSYNGTAGDAMNHHSGMPFSTKDRDNDLQKTKNCAEEYNGAWWYNSCHLANLNAKWGVNEWKGPRWQTYTQNNAATFIEMKIRYVEPIDFNPEDYITSQ